MSITENKTTVVSDDLSLRVEAVVIADKGVVQASSVGITTAKPGDERLFNDDFLGTQEIVINQANGNSVTSVHTGKDGAIHYATALDRSSANALITEATAYTNGQLVNNTDGHDPRLEKKANTLAEGIIERHGRKDGDSNLDVRSGTSKDGTGYVVQTQNTAGGDQVATITIDRGIDGKAGDGEVGNAGDVVVTQTLDQHHKVTTKVGVLVDDGAGGTLEVSLGKSEQGHIWGDGTDKLLARAEDFTKLARGNLLETKDQEIAGKAAKGEEVFIGAGNAVKQMTTSVPTKDGMIR